MREHRTASDTVARELRDSIQRRGLRPGDRIGRMEDLARELGVSRLTLREALRLLESSRMIRSVRGPGGGVFVEATPEQGIGHDLAESVASMVETEAVSTEDLLELRMMIEVPLAGFAAQRATDEEVAELRAIVRRSEAAIDQGGLVGVVDDELHRTIAAAARNPLARAFMTWVVDVLAPMLRTIVEPAVVDVVIVDQHRAIVEAIARRNVRLAEREMREHILYTRDLVDAVGGLSPQGGGSTSR